MGITTNRQQPECYQFVGATRTTAVASAWTQVAHTETTNTTRDLYIYIGYPFFKSPLSAGGNQCIRDWPLTIKECGFSRYIKYTTPSGSSDARISTAPGLDESELMLTMHQPITACTNELCNLPPATAMNCVQR